MATVLWAERLLEQPEKEALSFQSSISVDKRLVFVDIQGSQSHVKMLAKQGILSAETAAILDKELSRIARDVEQGTLKIDDNAEDIHSFIENVLTERLGDIGRTIHAGRSRNDQVATDFRLYLKCAVSEIIHEVHATVTTVLDKAEAYAATIMPGYTHVQRAQPITVGFHLTAWASALIRDSTRFQDALKRFDECPLGAGALATSTLALDREYTASDLGFNGPVLNAMDAVSDRDFALECAAACAIVQTHLSRFCEDIILWSSAEFNFMHVADKWSTGSSIMPQKKNPDFAELIRGKTGRVNGNIVCLLTVLKGLPYAYAKDLQEDKEALFDSIDTVKQSLRMFRGMFATASFHEEQMKSACTGGFLEATDAAEYLVKKGLPFRTAHEVVARVVRDCIESQQHHIAERSLHDLKVHSTLFEADIYDLLRPEHCVNARTVHGGTNPQEVLRQINVLRTMYAAQ
jgi:argininosuccinate lyase